jgi:hypothetical protein
MLGTIIIDSSLSLVAVFAAVLVAFGIRADHRSRRDRRQDIETPR